MSRTALSQIVLACDPDAIVCNSFSKFFGMTGWRLGWAILPDDSTVLGGGR